MEITSRTVLDFFYTVAQIYDFFVSVWLFFFNNTVDSAFFILSNYMHQLFDGYVLGNVILTLFDFIYEHLILGTFIGDMNMLLFIFTVAIVTALTVGFAKFYTIKDV